MMSECRHDGGICRHLDRIEALLQRQIDMMSQGPEMLPIDEVLAKVKAQALQTSREIDARREQEHLAWEAANRKPTEGVN